MAGAAAGDSGWWELDSSEAIPTPPAATPAVGGRRQAGAGGFGAAATVPAANDWAIVEDSDDDLPGSAGLRPASSLSDRKWVKPAAIAAGAVIGSIAFAVMYTLVSGATRSALSPDGEPDVPRVTQTAENQAGPTARADQAGEPETKSAASPSPATPSPAVSRHRETVEDLIRAYNLIADGYARIRDTNSIAAGRAQIARGAVQLRASAHRGKSLPALSRDERKALIRQSGPHLLRAIDRVLDELRRLKATDGIRSDFDRLIDAYTHSRQQAQHALDSA